MHRHIYSASQKGKTASIPLAEKYGYIRWNECIVTKAG